MNPRTLQFLIFCAFSVASLVGGYVARRQRWLPETASRPLHWITMVILWSITATLVTWKLPLQASTLWLLAIEPLLVILPALAVIKPGQWLGLKREQIGVAAIAAGLGNLGFTLGGYLCYALLTDPALLGPHSALPRTPAATADAALAYAVAQVTIMAVVGILTLYPVAAWFSPERREDRRLGSLVWHSLVDWRAMMMYASVLGVVLDALHVPYPEQIGRWHVLTVLFYLGSFGAYFGIGLRLHLGHFRQSLRSHLLVGGAKFLFIPLLTVIILLLINLTGAAPDPLAQRVLIVEAFMPAAIQTVMIANLFHLDTRESSMIWLVNTVAFLLIPLPIILVSY